MKTTNRLKAADHLALVAEVQKSVIAKQPNSREFSAQAVTASLLRQFGNDPAAVRAAVQTYARQQAKTDPNRDVVARLKERRLARFGG